jgi:uncharacterized protein YjbJ (UPF0337 family)
MTERRHIVNDDILKGQWRQVRGNVRETFGRLTDDDLEQAGGNMENLLGKIQERYGYTKEQARMEWDRFWNNYQTNNPNRDRF